MHSKSIKNTTHKCLICMTVKETDVKFGEKLDFNLHLL